jgi:hypothetical protein
LGTDRKKPKDQDIEYFKHLLRTLSKQGKINVEDVEFIERKKKHYNISDDLFNQLLNEVKTKSKSRRFKFRHNHFIIMIFLDLLLMAVLSAEFTYGEYSNEHKSALCFMVIIIAIIMLLLIYSYIISLERR